MISFTMTLSLAHATLNPGATSRLVSPWSAPPCAVPVRPWVHNRGWPPLARPFPSMPLAPRAVFPVEGRTGRAGRTRLLDVRCAAGAAAEDSGDVGARAAEQRAAIAAMDGSDPESIAAVLAGLEPPRASYARRSPKPPDDWLSTAKRVIESDALDHDTQLEVLERLAPELRSQLLAKLGVDARKHLTGPHEHPTATSERPVRFDWRAWDDPGAAFCETTAWGMATLTHKLYDDFPVQGRGASNRCEQDLERGGFQVQFIGDERTPESKKYGGDKEPRLATPFLIAVRGNLAIVAIRGTMSERSKALDFKYNLVPGYGGRVHQGFDMVASEVLRELEPALDRLVAALPPGKKLRVLMTGHSLGAVAAALVASRLLDAPGIEIGSIYGFGMPMSVDAAARRDLDAKGVSARLWRIENHCDPIIRLPPPFISPDYVHFGRPVYLSPECRHQLDHAHECRLPDLAASGFDAHKALVYARKGWFGGVGERAGASRAGGPQGHPPAGAPRLRRL